MSSFPSATNVIKLRDARQTRAHRQTLCRAGFHKWQVETAGRFDVKQGRLLTVERCPRCGEQRVKRTHEMTRDDGVKSPIAHPLISGWKR